MVPTAVRALLPLAGAIVVLLAPLDLEGHARSALAIATAMVLSWLVDLLHPAIVGFIGCFLFRAAGVVDFEGAFAGFGTETPWFLYGSLLLCGAADRSGLVRALGAVTPRAFADSRLPPVVALIALAYVLAFVVPSSLARATILVIPALAWTGQRQERPEASNAGVWLVVVAGYAAATFGHPEMPGGALAIAGWDVAAAAAVVAAVFFFGGRVAPETRTDGRPPDAETSSNPVDVKVATPVALAIALWTTTPLHGLSPALVGLGCGLLCCLPGIAPSNGHKLLNVDHLAVVFVGTAISIPAVLVETKAAEALARFWSSAASGPGALPQDLVAYWSATAYRLFSPDAARPPLPPLAGALGSAAIWSYAGSTLVSLHQSPALILAMSVGACRARHILTVGLFMIMLGSIVVLVY